MPRTTAPKLSGSENAAKTKTLYPDGYKVLFFSLHQRADEVGVLGGILERQTRDKQSLAVENLGVLARLVDVGLNQLLHLLNGGVVHVELEHALSLHAAVGLDGVEVLLHLERDTALRGQADGVGYKLL